MIFSEDSWKRDGEMKMVIPVSTGLSWPKMAPSLAAAETSFLLPLLGKALTDEIDGIYWMDAEDRTDAEKEALRISQVAVANLALWSDFDALNMRISDQGFQRQMSDSWQPAYKYQEDALRRKFAAAGFGALDQLLAFLEANQREFPLYTTSPARTESMKSLVRNTAEVQDIWDIGNSRLIFLRLRPVLTQVEELTLQPLIGDTLYAALRKYLDGDPVIIGGDEIPAFTCEELRDRCRKVVVMAAVLRMLRTTGELTDKGAYFANTVATGGGNNSSSPVADVRLQLMVNDAETAMKGYTARLTSWVKSNLSDYSGGDPLGILNHENDNRAAFWA